MAESSRGSFPAVRRALPSDADSLASLDVPGLTTAAAWCAEFERRDALAWMWSEDGQPGGALVARRTLDQIEVHQLWVVPAHRRRGGADLLLACALEEAREVGASEVHLEVRASNQAAIGCYAKHGFVATGRRPRYYPGAPREDAVLLTRVLSS